MQVVITGEKLVSAAKWALIGLVIPFSVWLWRIDMRLTSIESAESVQTRLQNLEDVMFPALVWIEVQRELTKVRPEVGPPSAMVDIPQPVLIPTTQPTAHIPVSVTAQFDPADLRAIYPNAEFFNDDELNQLQEDAASRVQKQLPSRSKTDN